MESNQEGSGIVRVEPRRGCPGQFFIKRIEQKIIYTSNDSAKMPVTKK
jgi:hypothetical protein